MPCRCHTRRGTTTMPRPPFRHREVLVVKEELSWMRDAAAAAAAAAAAVGDAVMPTKLRVVGKFL